MKTIRIGRGSNNDVVINDSVVSSNHAVITISDFGEVSIEDKNSKNGTYVDGKRITKANLSSSSIVLLGNHSIDWKQIIQTTKTKSTRDSVEIPQDVIEKKLIGRNHLSQVRYSFDDVSDKHAYICKKSNGDIVLVDNNSTNGTYVNGSKILHPHVLKKGDHVAISNKHPLNWEAIYPQGIRFNTKVIIPIVASIMLLIVIFILKPWTWGTNWSDVYAEHKNDVVLVYVKSAYATTIQGKPLSAFLNGYDELDYCCLDADGDVASGIACGYGTGFFISKDGKLLTNKHVVTDLDKEKNTEYIKRKIQAVLLQNDLGILAANVEVDYVVLSIGIAQNDTYLDSENQLIPCTILKLSDNTELDVAILQTHSKSIPTGSTYVDLSKSTPVKKISPGYEICTIGFPKSILIGTTAVGLEANNQSGEITQERGTYEYGHNIFIHQGASGSPVYDKKGRFAGIIVSGFLGISQGYNHAIHPSPIIDFVNKTY